MRTADAARSQLETTAISVEIVTAKETGKPTDDEVAARRAAALSARKDERTRLIARLDDDGEDDLADILRGCGNPLKLHCVACGDIKVVEQRCRKRWCPVCARQISAKRVAKYAGAVARMQWPLFVTLTRRNLRVIKIDDIKHMRRAYRKMRQRVWWTRMVRGGIASLEITNTGKGWHPHIHSILDCRWLAVRTPPPKPTDSRDAMRRKFRLAASEVGDAWAHALGHKRASVHVKRAYTPRDLGPHTGNNDSIAVEVLKYSVKATDLIDSPEPIGDLIRLLGAARLVSSWGSMYGRNLVDDPDADTPRASCDCGACGSLVPDEIVNVWARQAWTNARR